MIVQTKRPMLFLSPAPKKKKESSLARETIYIESATALSDKDYMVMGITIMIASYKHDHLKKKIMLAMGHNNNILGGNFFFRGGGGGGGGGGRGLKLKQEP